MPGKKLLGLIKYILMSNKKVLAGIFQSVRLHHYASRCHKLYIFFLIMMLWVNETICSKRLIEERIKLILECYAESKTLDSRLFPLVGKKTK